VTLLFISASQACSVHVAKWYELHGVVDTRDTCAFLWYFVLIYCHDILRHIVTLAILVSSRRYRR